MTEPPKRANHKGNIKFLNPRKPPPVMGSNINLFIINGQSKPNWSIPSRVILISDEIRFRRKNDLKFVVNISQMHKNSIVFKACKPFHM
jgi:hypothetical protein